ncbi:MAG: PAS domain S-box protein [Bacteroidota bacterium]
MPAALVVSQQPIRGALVETLKARGYLVVQDTSDVRPNLVFVDDTLSLLACETLRQEWPETGLIVLVGDRPQPYLKALLDAGADDLLKLTDVQSLDLWLWTVEQRLARRRGTEATIKRLEARSRAILETTADGIITIDENGRIERFNRAAERLFGYAAHDVIGQDVAVLMPAPYRNEHDGYITRYLETGQARIIGVGRQVAGQRKSGETFPLYLAVSEILIDQRRVFTGIVRDLTEHHRLEQEVLSVSERERQRIGRDLHDDLGQRLTGITLIARNLARRLARTESPYTEQAEEIVDMVKQADYRARALARGLVPVALEGGTLPNALERLAEKSTTLYGIGCAFAPQSKPFQAVTDAVATHLYRIAQEALSNAIRHGKPSQVEIRLRQSMHELNLCIDDNGCGGIPDELGDGLGIRTMTHRAHLMGGVLHLEESPLGGVRVRAVVPRQVWSTTTTDFA